jgi:hypothetical protein
MRFPIFRAICPASKSGISHGCASVSSEFEEGVLISKPPLRALTGKRDITTEWPFTSFSLFSMVNRLIEADYVEPVGADQETLNVQADCQERIADTGMVTFSQIDALRIQADALKASGASRSPFMHGMFS